MTEEALSPTAGQQVGDYLVVDRIAVGGMAEVFRARRVTDAGEGRIVVLKRMLPHIAAEAGGVEMFDEEARIIALVDHDNVVELVDSFTEDGHPFLALEYVPGCDLWRLSRWLVRNGSTMSTDLVLYVTRELLAGLQAVHDATDEQGNAMGIIHQDVSPSNVLLSIYGDVKLGDFGIARSIMRSAKSQGRAKGKLGYLAPEQVTGHPTGPQTDVFATGVICAELFIKRPLFSGGSELAILLAIRDANIRPFLDMELRADVKEVVGRALARKPDDRLPSAQAFRVALDRFLPDDCGPLRKELAQMVRMASGMEVETQLTPPVDVGEPEIDPEATPITVDLPTQTYSILSEGGGPKGPFSFAELVEAITTGRIGPDDSVVVDGGEPERVRDHSSLSRYLPMSTQTPITQDARVAQEPDIRRSLKRGGLIRALAETALRADTGLWLCEHGGVRKEVYIADGTPEYVSSNLAGEMLGEFLVSSQVISRGELDMALAVLPRFDGRLGDTLVGLGLIEPVNLFQHIAAQVREKLLDLFLWTSGNGEFYRGVPPPPSGFPLGLDLWDILDEGIDRRLEAGLEEDRFAARIMDALVRVRQLPSFVEDGVISDSLRRLLDMTLVPTPLPTIVDAFAQGDDARAGYRIVLIGLVLEVVQWDE